MSSENSPVPHAFNLARDLVSTLSSLAHGHDPNNRSPTVLDMQSMEGLQLLVLQAQDLCAQCMNPYRPINRLPPEILSYIFFLVPESASADSTVPPSCRPRGVVCQPCGLVLLMMVCRHWRDISLNTSYLWSTIEDRKRRLRFPHSLHRVPPGPLHVVIDGVPETFTRTILAQYGKRIQDLQLYYQEKEFDESLHELISFSADELQRCNLVLDRYDHMASPFVPIFQGHTPNLQALHASRAYFLPRNTFPALAHLSLDFSSTDHVAFTYQDFQTFLASCPALRSLHIVSLANVMIAPSILGKHISAIDLYLQQLQRYSMVDSPWAEWSREPALDLAHHLDNCNALQSSLRVFAPSPPRCLVYLWPVRSRDLHGHASHLAGLGMQPTAIRIIHRHQSYWTPSEFEALSIQLIVPSTSRGARFDVPIGRYYEDSRTVQAHLHSLLASSPLFATIHELWAGPGFMQLLCTPRSILRSLPRLRFVEVVCSVEEYPLVGAVLDAFMHTEHGAVPCPELDTLFIALPDGDLVEKLREVVVRRASAGHPLKRLLLSLHSVRSRREVADEATLDAIRRLGTLVERFHFDEGDALPPHFDDQSWDSRLPPECLPEERGCEAWPSWEARIHSPGLLWP